MKILRILLLEDDVYFRADIAKKLKAYGHVTPAGDLAAGLAALRDNDFDVALIDLNLNGEDAGLEVIRACLDRGVTPIVLTGNDDPQMVARAYELGGKHYFSKLDVQSDLDRELGYYLRSIARDELDQILAREFVTRDPQLRGMLAQLRHQNLNRDQRVLLLGPTGAGKTKLAKLIHQLAEESAENFVHLNLAEVPDNLVESMLFGHRRGAFTGANEDREGFFAKANGGTLFLDEIGSIPLNTQKKLLKVLEEKEFTALGSTQVQRSDFRLIAATCEDLPKLIEAKRFRLDLYFRLKGIELTLPPLKERRADIPELVAHFARRGARRVHFTPAAMEALVAYDWHGNVRELEQTVRYFLNGTAGVINLGDLPTHIRQNTPPHGPNAAGEEDQKLYTRNIATFIQRHGLRKFFSAVEREAFADLYARTSGNLTKTQLSLGISKSAAYRILESIQRKPARDPGESRAPTE